MDAETADSRLTLLFVVREPRFVRRSVSGDIPTLKVFSALENSVMVRHVPLMEMESPRAASARNEGRSEVAMVREVPEPPELVESRSCSVVTAAWLRC